MADPIIGQPVPAEKTPPSRRNGGGANLVDRTGQRHGRLVVIRRAESRKGATYWLCQCDCGGTLEADGANLRKGVTASCGCLRREVSAQRRTTHGESSGGTRTPEYKVWQAIHTRCNCPTDKAYRFYGGRGIRVCAGWASRDNFLADMGRRPGRGYSIDRKDNSAHYSCGHCEECVANGWDANCRWATRTEQANNKRNNRMVTVEGVTKTVPEWARETSIPSGTIHRRLRLGWSEKEAATTPVKHGGRLRNT